MLRKAPSLLLFASLSCLEYTHHQEGAYEHKESPAIADIARHRRNLVSTPE
jgi:hypothetical protein